MRECEYKVQMIAITLLDIAAILISFLTANYIRNQRVWPTDIPEVNSSIVLYMILVYLVVTFFRNAKRNFFRRGIWSELIDLCKGITEYMALLIVSIFAFQMGEDLSRLAILYFWLLLIVLVFVLRSVYKWCVLRRSRKNMYTKRMVVMTLMDEVEETLKKMDADRIWDSFVKGLIILDVDEKRIGQEVCGIPIIGNYETMFTCVSQRVVDEIFINVPYSNGYHVGKAIEQYEAMGIAVSLNIQVYNLRVQYKQKELREIGDYYVITFRQSVSDMKMRVVKRVMDIAGAIVGLVITAVITVFLAPVLLLESPGPLVFSQTRVGLNGRKFKIYKFRSMYKDAEERKKELMAKNEMNGLMFKMTDDPRITKVGKFIRKTSIDELPQFWNVLKGDMSLIGTRPPTLDEFEKYELEYKRRLSIRPGITGMWQASGRSDITDFEDVLALDLEYIDNWSISLDIKILLKTVFGVFMGDGAR